MSATPATVATFGAAGRSAGVRSAWRAVRIPVLLFAASRLLVFATGVIGVLTLHKHDPAAVHAYSAQLGPLGYALAGSAYRFDAGDYLVIAGQGYGPASHHLLAFFPLYPLLIRELTPVVGNDVLAGVLISAVSFLAALIGLHRLTELHLGRAAAGVTVALVAFAPLSFFFTAVYTESLFLALAVGAMLAADRGRFRLACGLGALATLTRPVGILLVVGLAVARLRQTGRPDRRLAWVVALPATLGGYLAVLAAEGYPPLAPFSAQTAWGRQTTGPVSAVLAAIWAAIKGVARVLDGGAIYHPVLEGPFTAGTEAVVLLTVLGICVAALVACFRRLPLQYVALAAAVLLVTLSSPALGQPLWSFDRFALTIFPLWMAAGAWLSERRLRWPVLALSVVALVFYTLQFSSWAFVA